MNEIIKLSNGSEVTWDEFSKWSSNKQRNNLNPYRNFGHRSKETREKMSSSTTLWWTERKQREKIIAPNRGTPHSEETKRKIGIDAKKRLTGVPKTEAHRQAMREAASRILGINTVIVTPFGEFNDKESAAAGSGIEIATLKYRMLRKNPSTITKG